MQQPTQKPRYQINIIGIIGLAILLFGVMLVSAGMLNFIVSSDISPANDAFIPLVVGIVLTILGWSHK